MMPRYPLETDIAVALSLLSVLAWMALFLCREQAARRIRVIWLECVAFVGERRVAFEQWVCGLHGHDALLHFENGRQSLLCSSCGHESPGWDCQPADLKYEQPSAAAVLTRERDGGWR